MASGGVGVKTNEQLTNELRAVRDLYNGLVTKINDLQTNVDSRPKLSDLARSESTLTEMITNNSTDISTLENKLSKIILPEDPRYYLTQNEVTNFQSNLSKLLAMMASFEQLYRNLVAYSSNLSTT